MGTAPIPLAIVTTKTQTGTGASATAAPAQGLATSVSYGSILLWHTFAKRPEMFAGGLVTGGFQISDAQAKAIAAAEVPLWVTHGINDRLLNISLGGGTNRR
jgi:hypothetical protein